MSYLKRLTSMYGGIGMSASSLHRESSDIDVASSGFRACVISLV